MTAQRKNFFRDYLKPLLDAYLDDFAIKKLTAEQVLDLMEIVEDRYSNKSTIFASQLPVANWNETLDSNVSAADAILDRVVNTASIFTLKGDSLRKKH